MNKTMLKDMLTVAGLAPVSTTADAARVLKVSVRLLNSEKNAGRLRYLERNAISFDSIVDWLYAHPHFQTKLTRR